MRPPSACLHCRASKRKCRPRLPFQSCVRCEKLSLECNFAAIAQPSIAASALSAAATTAAAAVVATSTESGASSASAPTTSHALVPFMSHAAPDVPPGMPVRRQSQPQLLSQSQSQSQPQSHSQSQPPSRHTHDGHHRSMTLGSYSPRSRSGSTVTSTPCRASSPASVSPEMVAIPLAEGLPYWCLSTALQEELAQLYFKYVHGTHHSLFQRMSVIEALRVGRLPPVILYGIMALGARFSDNPLFANENRWTRGVIFADRAFKLLDLTDISIVTIQGALLIGTWCYAECRPQAEALYNTIANRLAIIIDLPHRPTASEMEKQENLRVYWTLYMHDTWGSTALQLPKQFSLDESVPLPADEVFFMSLTRTTPPIQGPLPSGIWGEIPKLTKLLAKIQAMHKAFVAGSLDNASLSIQVDSIFRKLQRWSNSLPPNLRETRANMERHAALSLGPEFVSLHLAYHYYHEILFYQFLAEGVTTQDGPATPESLQARYYAEQCTKHAVAFCDLLYTCYTIPGCEVLYVMIGHMLVVTSTVYIHLLLFSRDEERITLARERLARNFEILVMLQRYWKALDLSLARLKKFHNACQSSIEGTFRMDKWMLRFILEYNLDMSEKYASTPTPNITSMSYGLAPQPQYQFQPTNHMVHALADVPLAPPEGPQSASPNLDLQHWYALTFQ